MDAPLTELTPELAEQLLSRPHPRQRRPSRQIVAQYAATMRAGLWRPEVPDPILVDPDRRLFNGAHRCAAVIDSGVTITVPIIHGADPALFDVIDVGRRRSAFQFITDPDATVRASSARVMLWYRRRFDQPLASRTMGLFDMSTILHESDRASEDLGQAMPLARAIYEYTSIPMSIGAAVFVLASEDGHPWDMLTSFRDGVVDMSDLPDDDPRRALAERMRQKAHRDRRRQPLEDWTILVRALNRHLLGESSVRIEVTKVWPKIGKSEAEFKRRRVNVAMKSQRQPARATA